MRYFSSRVGGSRQSGREEWWKRDVSTCPPCSRAHPFSPHATDTFVRFVFHQQPAGKLCRDEFFTACKLLAVAQDGGDIAIAAIPGFAPLPRVGSHAGKQPAKPPAHTPAATEPKAPMQDPNGVMAI